MRIVTLIPRPSRQAPRLDAEIERHRELLGMDPVSELLPAHGPNMMVLLTRARLLTLTAEGQRVLAECRPVVENLQAEILAPLSVKERAAFVALANKALGIT